jgi:hypothetical protein
LILPVALLPGISNQTPSWIGLCFIVHDASGQALAYVYFDDEPGRRAEASNSDRGRGIFRTFAQNP